MMNNPMVRQKLLEMLGGGGANVRGMQPPGLAGPAQVAPGIAGMMGGPRPGMAPGMPPQAGAAPPMAAPRFLPPQPPRPEGAMSRPQPYQPPQSGSRRQRG